MKVSKNAKKNEKTTTKTEKPAEEKKAKPGFAYDDSKDEVIKDYGIVKGSSARNGDISVRVVAYNGGEPKLALMRTGLNKADEPWFSARLGRLTIEELNELLPLITKAQSRMSKTAKEK